MKGEENNMQELKKERLSVNEAAKVLGCGVSEIREQMKRGNFKIGIVIPPRDGECNYRYHIYRSMLERFISGEEWKDYQECEE